MGPYLLRVKRLGKFQNQIDKKLKKHLPSGQVLLFRGGITILICIAIGMLYSILIMDVPAGVEGDKELSFRMGIGLGLGIFGAVIPVVILLAVYLTRLRQAIKEAAAEFSDSD